MGSTSIKATVGGRHACLCPYWFCGLVSLPRVTPCFFAVFSVGAAVLEVIVYESAMER